MLKPRLRFVSPSTVDRVLSSSAVTHLLSTQELEHFRQLDVEKRRRDWLAGRLAAKAVARDAVQQRDGITPALTSLTVLNDSDGAPYLVCEGRPQLDGEFNISIAHHDGFAVAALANTTSCGVVGVDLEWNRPLADRLLQRILSTDERDRLKADPSARAPSNMALWCLKEAVLKASRKAARASMRHVDLCWDQQRHGGITAHILDRDHDDTWFSAAWRRHGAHVLAYAISRSAGAN